MIIDLSVVLNDDTPVYPGDPKTKVTPAGIFDKDGYNDHYISTGNHTGTHIDAPLHMIKDGKTLEQFPLETFIGSGICVDARSGFSLETVMKSNIRANDIVLFYTDKSANYHSPSYYEDYKEIPEDIAGYLVEQKVKMVGVDMCSPDHEPFNIHKLLLKNDILIIENLTNLDKLLGKEFTVYALPIKLDLDAAPARAVAHIEVR